MKARHLPDVLTRIIRIMDANGCDATKLKAIHTSARFTAPETMADRWLDAQKWLNENLPNPCEPKAPKWARQVARLWSGDDGR